jgi:hypothetical protein
MIGNGVTRADSAPNVAPVIHLKTGRFLSSITIDTRNFLYGENTERLNALPATRVSFTRRISPRTASDVTRRMTCTKAKKARNAESVITKAHGLVRSCSIMA